MSPTEVIARAAGDGVLIAFSPSGSISAKGVQSAIDRWLPAIRQNKAAIIGLLRPDKDGWSPWDWQLFFDERAGIAEFDGGLSRAEAEARAFACCLAEWLNRNPMRSPPGRCFGCGDTGPRTTPSSPSVLEVRARPSCIRAAPPLGTPGGRPKRSLRWRRWGSDRQPTF